MEARQLKASSEAFHLSLRVRHPSMDPAEISRALHMKAEYSFKAGEVRGRKSAVGASSHAESYWLAPLDPAFWEGTTTPASVQPYNLGMGALELAFVRCAYLLRRHAAFLHRVQAEGGEVSLLVEISTDVVSGFSLTPQCTGAFYDLGVSVDFEFTR